MAPLAALLEIAEAGELTPEKAVSAAQTALYLMGNAHQQTAQERRKKLILKLNPSLKFMAEDAKSFSSAAPMLFGEEFAKQAMATVEQVKAMKKLNIPSEKKSHFSSYHPQSYQSGRGGGAKSGRTRYQPYYKKPDRQASPTVQDRTAVRIKETETCTKLCKWSKRNYNLSPYSEFKHNTALNKEGNSNKFACWSNKRVHRELGWTGSIGCLVGSALDLQSVGLGLILVWCYFFLYFAQFFLYFF